MAATVRLSSCTFLSTPSGWRATENGSADRGNERDFYPRPPGGGRRYDSTVELMTEQFLSTPSGWRATRYPRLGVEAKAISIHALRVEGDLIPDTPMYTHAIFLSTPSGWRATSTSSYPRSGPLFLSTPSGWRATSTSRYRSSAELISIHALRVEGDHAVFKPVGRNDAISIHALRVEGDLRVKLRRGGRKKFLSTPSGWRATRLCDLQFLIFQFLSTPSGWRATSSYSGNCSSWIFLSTPSGWRATLSQPAVGV